MNYGLISSFAERQNAHAYLMGQGFLQTAHDEWCSNSLFARVLSVAGYGIAVVYQPL